MKKLLSIATAAALALTLAVPGRAGAQELCKSDGAPLVVQTVGEASVAKGLPAPSLRPASASVPSLHKAIAATKVKGYGMGHAPMRAAAPLPNLRGGVVFNDAFTSTSKPVGIYQILQGSTEMIHSGINAYKAAVAVDGVFYTTEMTDYGFMVLVMVRSYDLETGAVVGAASGKQYDVPAGGITVDPGTGTVYAITYNEDNTGFNFSKIAYTSNSVSTTPIAPISGNWSCLACDAQGQVYGISYDGFVQDGGVVITSSTLNKIDKTTGAVTPVGVTGQLPLYVSSAAIDPRSGRMFWNVCPADGSGSLCEVDLSTGAASKLFDFELNDEIVGMYVAAPIAEDDAPASVENLQALFPEGALSGNIVFDAPATLYDGTAATGSVGYKVLANDEPVAEGTAAYGEHVSVPLTMDASGEYTFTVVASNAAGDGPKVKTTVFVGHGTPATPSATLVYAGGSMRLEWTPVATAIGGGYIDPEAVRYTVTRYPGETVVADRTDATSFEEPVAMPERRTQYYYTVVAHSGDAVSAAGRSNVITLGDIIPPYTNDFADDGALDGYTIIDGNDDGKRWVLSGGQARIEYNSTLPMDDWLVTPAIKLEGGKAYKVTFSTHGQGNFPERLEAMWGAAPTADALTNVLVAPMQVVGVVPIDCEGWILPETTGSYYIGIHGISDPDSFYLFVDDLSIETGVSGAAPAAPSDFKAMPDYNGATTATITMTAPTVDFNGEELSSLDRIELARDGEVVHTWTEPAPGEALQYVDNVGESGFVTYTAIAYNIGGAGRPATFTVHVGIDEPEAPYNIVVRETSVPGELIVTWDAVTTDFNGNPINPELVTYIVAVNNDGWEPVVEGLHETTYKFRAVPEGEQEFVQVAVFASTAGGQNGMSVPVMPVGSPYKGLADSFADGQLHYSYAVGYSVGFGDWGSYTESQLGVAAQDGDNGYIVMSGLSLDDSHGIYTAKITLAGIENPGIRFYTYNICNQDGVADDINEIQLYVKEPADADWTALGEPVVINTLGDKVGWYLVSASLADYAGRTIQVRIQATAKQYRNILVDNLKIGALYGHDLIATSIDAPESVLPGEDYKVAVAVTNDGLQDAGAFIVELYADGTPAGSKSVDALAAGARAMLSFDFAMSAVADTPVDYYAVVKYDADENTSNNATGTITVAPSLSNLPKVTDLEGEDTGAGVRLAWSEPDLTNAPAAPLLHTFEDATPWATELDGWTFIDRDGAPVGGFQGVTIPGITAGQTLASFFVFDASDGQFNLSFDAHSGSKYLAALYRRDDGTTDDWLVSPALDGNAQTISFYARSYSSSYLEKIEMYYSTEGTDPDDFVLVKTLNPVPGGVAADESGVIWTAVSFDVPAGAKHFAIRSCATGSMMLELDDFSFVPYGHTSELAVVGYDIYRDGVKINDEPVGETEYVDTEAAAGEHSYVVITVYDRGNSAPSNAVSVVAATGISDATAAGISVSAGKGTITVSGAEGLHLSVAAVDGKVLYSATAAARTTVNVATGVYVVKAGNMIVKVAVK
ncbi:MAG: choice-of-anchor J domain-containing protein [Muribaculaceae bacterium]|nr:choice-of-anchor J domain-containing protein [Muribaculaceae bacterium]